MSDAVRIDPHVKLLDEELVERASRRGLDAVVYAPHFTRLPDIQATADRLTTDDLLVVPGREVFTGSWRERKHVLALGLDEPVPDFISLDAAMAEFERQDATVLAPHPEFLTVGLEAADLREYADAIDAIDVANPKHWPHHDRRARGLAADLGLPAFGSSYAHLSWTIGDVWTEFDATALTDGAGATGTDAAGAGAAGTGDSSTAADAPADAVSLEDSSDVEAALAHGDRRVRRRRGVGPSSRSVAEFAHLFWENSAKKFDRVVLSGQEATHPHQPAYDGRFDDAFVY